MRQTQGWTKTPRLWGSDEPGNPFTGDGLMLALWIVLNSQAAWEDEAHGADGRPPRKLGQLYTTYGELSAQLGCTVKQLRTRLDRLVAIGYISDRTTLQRGLHAGGWEGRVKGRPRLEPKGRPCMLITICNNEEKTGPKKQEGRPRLEPEGRVKGRLSISKNISKNTIAEAGASSLFPGEVEEPEPPRKPSKAPRKPKDPSPGTETWAAYCEALKTRNIAPPLRDAKTNAQCAKIAQLAAGSLTKTKDLIDAYIANDNYYEQGWSLGWLLAISQGMLNKMQAKPPSKMSKNIVDDSRPMSAEEIRQNKYAPEVLE